ncbi:hypothetical protein V8C42DRAFT_262685 [Trichoderma barbatum]
MTSVESKVYRLRGIPEYLDRLGVARLVSKFIPDGDQRDVNVASLAFSCEIWATRRTKTATLTFNKLPGAVIKAPAAGEWPLPDPALGKPLILDDNFFGLSPLNDVPENEHHYDCIVMSGLASHPMGSWQPHGEDKSFMWIRDALPHLVPNVKFILYGYDTKLAGSDSFQRVSDIALTFLHALQRGGWTAPGPRKLIFFAHSLGGIILKEALLMVADSDVMDELILNRTIGAIFFGVPSQGLDVSDLQIMLQGQPNRDALVDEISTKSKFVEILEKQVLGISHIQKMKLFWAYETKTTPTVIQTTNGNYKRAGPGTIFVSPQSATGQRCNFDPGSTIQIDANHSDMVKLSEGNELVKSIAYKLQEILMNDTENAGKDARSSAIDKKTAFDEHSRRAQSKVDHVDPAADPEFWDIHSVIDAIHAPERDNRLEQIGTAAGHSFVWAFEKSSIGLTSWLQNDEKLFWISGKPASGKSTFMKYLHNNSLTADYLRKWYRSANRVRATFFFHHRGTAIQKSLEGLYRGILSQILEQAPDLFLVFQPTLAQAYRAAVDANNLGSLSHDLAVLIELCKVAPDAEISRQKQKVLRCEMPLKAFRTMVVEPMSSRGVNVDNKSRVHQVYLRRDELLVELNNDKANGTDNLHQILEEMKWTRRETRKISLVKQWLEAIDINVQLSDFKHLLIARGSKEAQKSKHFKSQLGELMEEMLDRFSARKELQDQIETGNWSLQQLNDLINCVANQKLVDLDLCVFIDALDEHDGPPEFICQFIQELTSVKGSLTRVKILFSSRPWQPFIIAFADSPSIQIHEFTENDIRELCLQTIVPDRPGSAEILQLVEEIIQEARGVFLWVKLVLNDLLDSAARLVASGDDTVDIHAALIDILKSLPKDLEPYYKAIIERIPYSYRWEAFCLLEVVSKAIEPIYLGKMSIIQLCTDIQKASDIYQLSSQYRASSAGDYTKEQLRVHSGGLVEVTQSNQLQLLHQTLVEFIQLPNFRRLVLGDRYRVLKENGYSILSKYKAFRHDVRQPRRLDCGVEVIVDEVFSYYATRAESTTGKSMHLALTGVTWIAPLGSRIFPTYLSDAPYTTLEVAVACGLKLLLRDTLKLGKGTTAVLIFPILMHMIELKLLDTSTAMDMLRNIVAQGLQIHASHIGLLILMDRIHNTAPARVRLEVELGPATAIDFCQSIMAEFFEPGATIEVGMSIPTLLHDTSHLAKLMLSHGRKDTIQALHISSHFELTKYLLEKGADPNGLTSKQLTPLDCWVRSGKGCERCRYSGSAVAVLIEHGGRLNLSTRREWEVLAETILDDLPFPGWLEGAPGAGTEESPAASPRRSWVREWLRNFSRLLKGR